jgi:hypothetical protein
VDRIVVGRFGILAHVEAGESPRPFLVFRIVGIDRPMRLKSCSPSPWCIQSDWTMNSL